MTKKMLAVTIEEEIIIKLKELAKKENRNLSNTVETILKQYFEQEE